MRPLGEIRRFGAPFGQTQRRPAAVASLPAAPTGVTITGEAAGVVETAVLSITWTRSAGDPADGSYLYTVQVATDAGFTALIVNQSGINAASLTTSVLTQKGTLYVRVWASAGGLDSAAAAHSFLHRLFKLTATTTGAGQTVTLQRITPTGTSTTVYWGDGTSDTIAAGSTGVKTHVYAAAGAYTVVVNRPSILTSLHLQVLPNVTVGAGEIGGLNALTSLTLNNLPNVTVGAGEIGGLNALNTLHLQVLPNATVGAGEIGGLNALTYLYLNNLPNATVGAGEIGGLNALNTLYLQVLPNVTVGAGEIGGLNALTYLTLNNLPNATVGAGEIGGLNALTSLTLQVLPNLAVQTGLANLLRLVALVYENNLSNADQQSILSQLYAAFPTRINTGGTIDLLGGGNAVSGGILQAACPPTTTREYGFELTNDSCSVSLKHWASVTLQN